MVTASSYTDCLTKCDNDGKCLYYSFFLRLPVANCLLIDALSPTVYLTPTPDQDVNSGYFIHA
jgi:hypothetical protein